MPTLPEKNPVSTVDLPLRPAERTPDHQREAADPHAGVRNLGSVNGDPTNTPADGQLWFWQDVSGDPQYKVKLGDGTVHVLAPFEEPVYDQGSGSSPAITTGGVSPSNCSITLAAGTWIVQWTCRINVGTVDASVEIRGVLTSSSGSPTISNTQAVVSPQATGEDVTLHGWALVEATAESVVLPVISKSANLGTYTLVSTSSVLVGFIPAGAASATGGGGGSALTVQEEDGTPSDTAVTVIKVPNGTLTDNGAGDVSLGYEASGAVATHEAAGDPHTGYRLESATVPVSGGGTGQTTQQAAIDALTAVSGATDEHVLTKDTATGNAIFKAAAGGGGTVSHVHSFYGQAAPGEDESAGDAQDYGYSHVAQTIQKIVILCDVAPGTNVVVEVQQNTGEDLDTESWTNLASITHTGKGTVTTSFTDSTIPADILLRMNIASISGTDPQGLKVFMETNED